MAEMTGRWASKVETACTEKSKQTAGQQLESQELCPVYVGGSTIGTLLEKSKAEAQHDLCTPRNQS